MYKINVKVSPDRRVSMTSYSGGITGENNALSLNFEIPYEYSSYNKYLDILKENGEKIQTVVSIKDEREFSYILPRLLSDNLNVYMQLVLKKENEIFKSERFVLTFEEGINVTSYLESEYTDSIEKLYEIKADKEDIKKISIQVADKLSGRIFYDEKIRMEDELLKKADLSDVNEKLLLKADKTELLTKVDKEEGKGLSSNDFTSEEKEKLLGIAEGAEVNVQADWDEQDDGSDSYIKNKPTIPAKLSDLADDSEEKPIFMAEYATGSAYSLNTDYAIADYEGNIITRTYAKIKDLPIRLSDLDDDSEEKPINMARFAKDSMYCDHADGATYADRAIADYEGNDIIKTYATKEELAKAIGEALEGDY